MEETDKGQLMTMIGDYVTLKQMAAERTMWRYSRGISRTSLQHKTEGRNEG